MLVPMKVKILAAEHVAVDPVLLRVFLPQGIVQVFGTKGLQKEDRIGHVQMIRLAAPSDEGNRLGSVLIDHLLQFLCNLRCRRIPLDLLMRSVSSTPEGRKNTLVVILIIGHGQTLVADVSLAERILLVPPHFYDSIVLDLHLQPTVVAADATSRAIPIRLAHDISFFRSILYEHIYFIQNISNRGDKSSIITVRWSDQVSGD